jgi:hypothetical protein
MTLGQGPVAQEAVPPPGAFGDPRALLLPGPEDAVQFHGFVNVEYLQLQAEADPPFPTFDLHNLFIGARARVAPGVRLFAEVEYEHGAEVRVDRAFVEWSVLPGLGLRAGRFYAPLSYERTHYYAPVRLMTSRPMTADIAFHEWADTGLSLFGRVGPLGYEVAVVNGPFGLTERGIPVQDVRDNNRDKTLVARLDLQPVSGVELGAAAARGRYDPDRRLGFRALELDVRIRRAPFELWAEALGRDGDDEPCAFAPGNGCSPAWAGARARQRGFYLLLAWTALEERPLVHYLKPLCRVDEVQTPADGTRARRLSLGLDWSPLPHLLLKAEAQWKRERGQGERRDDGFQGSLVADF